MGNRHAEMVILFITLWAFSFLFFGVMLFLAPVVLTGQPIAPKELSYSDFLVLISTFSSVILTGWVYSDELTQQDIELKRLEENMFIEVKAHSKLKEQIDEENEILKSNFPYLSKEIIEKADMLMLPKILPKKKKSKKGVLNGK